MTGRPFPVSVKLRTRELVDIDAPGTRITLCCHGARELARQLLEAADAGHCDGYRHGDDSTMLDAVRNVPTPLPVTVNEARAVVGLATLGMVREDVALLAKLAAYLEAH
jgi:hypothetical protein